MSVKINNTSIHDKPDLENTDAYKTPPVSFFKKLTRNHALLVLMPTIILLGVAVYGFLIWTGFISLTNSKMFPSYDFIGLNQYYRLWASDRWLHSINNLWVFSSLFIFLSIGIGLMLAIFLDQKIRAENFLRTIYLYPMAISFIVTGTAWKWILNPGLGIELVVRKLGFEDFEFDWLVDPEMSIYTLVLAAVWQSSGFVMALFLAGLRGLDKEILGAAKIDGAGPWLTYRAIIIPQLRPVFLTVIVILLFQAVRSFDLVVALTNGGPGYSSDLPTTFMYQYAFTRSQLGQGAASAMVILMTVVAIIVPYIYSELRHESR